MRIVLTFALWLALTTPAAAAGFDCSKTNTAVERLICGNEELSQADSRLVDNYQKLLAAFADDSVEVERQQQAQKTWLRESRNRCPDVLCLQSAYIYRNLALESAIPRPITLDAPIGGWRNSFGEEVAYSQVVRYPASTANTEDPADEDEGRLQQYARIRGRIVQAAKPLKLIVNGVPMPLLVDADGGFSRPYFFGTGSNSVEIRGEDGSVGVRRQFYEAYNEKLRPRLRVVLAWDSNSTDIDLHVITPKGEHCAYFDRTIPSGGALDVDVTTGYGPEIFSHPAPPHGTYLIYLNYYGGGYGYGNDDKTSEKTITVSTLTIVTEEGTPDERMQTIRVPMRRPGELIEAAKFVYP